MFNELKRKLYKMIIALGGIFTFIIFFGILLGSYFSYQNELENTLHDSFRTADNEQAIIPQKESCVFLLIYVDENDDIILNDEGKVKYEIFPQEYEEDEEFKLKYSWWFDGLAENINKVYKKDDIFKFNNRRYIFNNIAKQTLSTLNKRMMLFSILDYTSSYNNFQVMFFFLLVGYTLVTLLLSLASFIVAGKIVEPIADSFVKQKELVANASHELKTPLTIISASTSLLAEEQEIESKEKWLASINQQTDRMNQLIQQMLYLSKTESNLTVENKEDVNLSETIEKIAMEFDAIAFERKINIELNIQPNVIFKCNANNFNNLVTILLDNAIKYNNDNGIIRITLIQKKNKIDLSFFNTGKGIDKENIEKVFQRFYKVDHAYSQTSNQSFGLGLAIAKAIVTQMNGTIKVESTKDVSTTFTIKLQKRLSSER